MKTKNLLATAFLLVGFATVAEYLFIAGLFTGPLMLLAVVAVGLANAAWSLKDGERMTALLYLLATAGLSMGYVKLMFL